MGRGLAVVPAAVPASLPFLLALFLLPSVLTPLNIAAVGAPHSPPSLSAFASVSASSASASAAGERPVVFVLKIEGEITEGTYLDISEGIESAEKEGASAVLVEINTPGGLADAMLKTSESILNAKVPVVTYVAPEGAICASAGSLILISGHLAAMSPSTTVGAAMPVVIGAEGVQKADEKTIKFFAAHFRSVASARNRNETQAERFVTENDVLSEKEALERGIIDIVAADESELLREIDGMNVKVGGGNITLKTKDAILYFREKSLRSRILEVLSNPQIAVILLIVGIYGLIFGFMSPETYVPEMVGAICVVLALYGMGFFSVSAFGILLIVLAVILFIAEALTPTFGILTTGGAICLVLGALLLPKEPFLFSEGLFEGFLTTVVGVGVASAAFFLFAAAKIIRIRRKKPKVGELMGRTAKVIAEINGEGGLVKVRGEIWKAKSVNGEKVSEGETVEIVEREGLTLLVRKRQ